MTPSIKVLLFCILLKAHVVEPQLSQAQPCLVCGDAVLRLWSLMSTQGDRYIRITNNENNNHKIIDCGGALQRDNFTSLLKIVDRSTFDQTQIHLLLERNNQQYHLYAPSPGGELLALPASDGARLTDNSNRWAPERLLYEHRLFTVFQSVKYTGYYLSCDGSGKAVVSQIINQAYRQPNHLFLTIDPGNTIRGITFGSSNNVGRKKRELTAEEDANPARKNEYRRWQQRKYGYRPRKYGYWQYRQKNPYYIVTPKPTPSTTEAPPTYSSVVRNFDLPQNITFVLCFWIKTETRFAQLISITELIENMKKPVKQVWKRWRQTSKPPSSGKEEEEDTEKNIINVSIFHGLLRLQIGYQQITRTLPHCDIIDGKFHQICVSLNQKYLLEVYRDSEVILMESLPNLASDFENSKGRTKRRGVFKLGRTRGMQGGDFDGSLFQVNLWDQYPSFRIRRIATNCACGGGSLVSWADLLNGTMSDVNVEDNSLCPTLEGYSYDELTQNRLI